MYAYATVIGDILPYTQATATNGQTVFGTNWTANVSSDVNVYQTPAGTPPDDATQQLTSSQFSVAFIGGSQQVQVTLVSGANLGDIITIVRNTPADRLNLYSNTNFTPSMLNQDFGVLTLVDQQAQLVNQLIGPRYNYSADITVVVDTILPILLANQTWVKNNSDTAIIAITLGTAATVDASNPALQYVASVQPPVVVGHMAIFADTNGTIEDGGLPFGNGTVTSITAGTGLTASPSNPITVAGTISYAPIAANSFWANTTGSSAVPTVTPLSILAFAENYTNSFLMMGG